MDSLREKFPTVGDGKLKTIIIENLSLEIMTEHYSFADTVPGLSHAWEATVSLRRAGFTTRLATRNLAGTVLRTVVATPPARPPRRIRCGGNTR